MHKNLSNMNRFKLEIPISSVVSAARGDRIFGDVVISFFNRDSERDRERVSVLASQDGEGGGGSCVWHERDIGERGLPSEIYF